MCLSTSAFVAVHYLTQHLLKDPRKLTVGCRAGTVDSDGYGMEATMTDTLQGLSAEMAYRLFKTAVDRGFNAVTITEAEPDGRAGPIIYVNDAFVEMTGYSAGEVLGKSPGVLQGPNTEPEVLQRLADQIRQGQVFHGETINYRKDGNEFILEWTVIPIKDGEEVTHYVAVQHDVTGRL